jgi:aryl sulfotransferase
MSTPQTVWLASYPKSGNTWVRAMLAALTSDDDELDINHLGGGPIASGRPHIERWLGCASTDLTHEEIEWVRPLCDAALDHKLHDVRVRKIHDALWTSAGAPIVPPASTRAAIYLVRDPRDVAVSLAHHSGGSVEWAVTALAAPSTAMLDAPREIEMQTRQHLGTWSRHFEGWTEHELFPVHVVRYEDVAADPVVQLAGLAEFAGLEASADRLAAAVRSARFEALRDQEKRVGFNERPGRDRPFFRRGEAGAWRDELDPELARRVEHDHAAAMRRCGYL